MKGFAVLLLCACLGGPALAQVVTQRGFIETRAFGYPQTTPVDQGQVVGEGLVQWEVGVHPAPWLDFSGSTEARADTHQQTERKLHLDVQDRGIQRPALRIRSASATLYGGPFTLELGKQFVRWARTDILNPIDRFTPRDYSNIASTDLLGVLATRLNIQMGEDSLDLVWTPRFTPSRIPLLYQRWSTAPEDLPGVLVNQATRFPRDPQYGARYNHVGRSYEVAASYFEGFNHLPLIATSFTPTQPVPLIGVERVYPRIRMYGIDSAILLPWFTIRTEGGWFQSRAAHTSLDPQADDYALYVAQIDREIGDWSFAVGYAGQTIFEKRNLVDFQPDRGLARAFLTHAAYRHSSRTAFSLDGVIRQNGEGVLLRFEYTYQFAQGWQMILSAVGLRGDQMDFLGQFRRNSHGLVTLRYSF